MQRSWIRGWEEIDILQISSRSNNELNVLIEAPISRAHDLLHFLNKLFIEANSSFCWFNAVHNCIIYMCVRRIAPTDLYFVKLITKRYLRKSATDGCCWTAITMAVEVKWLWHKQKKPSAGTGNDSCHLNKANMWQHNVCFRLNSAHK